eukprot:648602-Prymnesium_polylepis.2
MLSWQTWLAGSAQPITDAASLAAARAFAPGFSAPSLAPAGRRARPVRPATACLASRSGTRRRASPARRVWVASPT